MTKIFYLLNCIGNFEFQLLFTYALLICPLPKFLQSSYRNYANVTKINYKGNRHIVYKYACYLWSCMYMTLKCCNEEFDFVSIM